RIANAVRRVGALMHGHLRLNRTRRSGCEPAPRIPARTCANNAATDGSRRQTLLGAVVPLSARLLPLVASWFFASSLQATSCRPRMLCSHPKYGDACPFRQEGASPVRLCHFP